MTRPSSIVLRLAASFLVAAIGFFAARALVRVREASEGVEEPNLPLYRSEALDALVGEVKQARSGTGVGWHHFLDPSGARAGPSVLGTAYGLKLLMMLDPDGRRLDSGSPVETLFAFQKDDGGWASSSQGAHSRPESTAMVLSALAPLVDQDARFRRATARLRQLVEAPDAESRLDLASVVSIVLLYGSSRRDLRDLAQDMCHRLCRGRQSGADTSLGYWPVRMGRGQQPSVVHTARAIVAIGRYLTTHGDPLAEEAVREGHEWLVRTVTNSPEQSLRTTQEEIRRNDAASLLHLRHFTSAWILRALSVKGEASARARRVRNIARQDVLRYRSGRLWRWPEADEEPIWMTYQALKALEMAG